MMSYKDRAFCPFYMECWHGEYCNRALTEEVKVDAYEWWKNSGCDGRPAICIFSDKPECFKEI